jgi:hypothetical protein
MPVRYIHRWPDCNEMASDEYDSECVRSYCLCFVEKQMGVRDSQIRNRFTTLRLVDTEQYRRMPKSQTIQYARNGMCVHQQGGNAFFR